MAERMKRMYMLLEGKTVAGFEQLVHKEKIVGFGQYVYMNKMCVVGEHMMNENKEIYSKLDYYAAPVYYLLGLPIDMYIPISLRRERLATCTCDETARKQSLILSTRRPNKRLLCRCVYIACHDGTTVYRIVL